MNGATSKFREMVTFTPDSSHQDRFLPQVLMEDVTRPFEVEDMPRVLDFEGAIVAPADSALKYGVDGATEGLKFPVYHFCLRGGFLFYFKVEDVDEESGPYVTYHDKPVGVIPLDDVSIEFPPGGRRVFREHAHTEAKTGYELVILHAPRSEDEPVRPPSFLVTESLTQREKWAAALRARADAESPTYLRAGYSSSTARKAIPTDTNEKKLATTAAPATTSIRTDKANEAAEAPKPGGRRATMMKTGAARSVQQQSIQQQVLQVSDDADLAGAVVEFGVAHFDEKEWIDHFFSQNNDFDAPSKCRQMEDWQNEMKRNLKGAVLEQYEYFVQASGEMTTMGLEVSSLRSLIESQVDKLKQMKQVDFSGPVDHVDGDELMGRSLDEDGLPVGLDATTSHDKSDDQSIFGEMSSIGDGSIRRNRSTDISIDDGIEDAPPIEVPDWLDDVTEEIAATMRECRYSDAIDLYLKAKAEIADLIDKHSRPTAYRLTKKQRDELRKISRELAKLGDRISERLEQSLRRKNEALRQALKRERSDVNAAIMANPVSPCALSDDSFYLQLLAKLGRNNEAAEAYSTRRSLLLLETLHERPISGAGSIDLVIYAAQLSQSFFSCLASSVEGFLDLFLNPPGQMNGDKPEDISLDASSLHSHSTKNLPAGAVASLVLWCDSELTKFASAFGGARVLANLALSPPPRDAPKQPRVVGGGPANDIHKERKNALEVAAQCIDQAFMYASSNLDGVGLPLTPRLAECIRMRLKGCEGEISGLLEERWQHLTAEWRVGEFEYGR